MASWIPFAHKLPDVTYFACHDHVVKVFVDVMGESKETRQADAITVGNIQKLRSELSSLIRVMAFNSFASPMRGDFMAIYPGNTFSSQFGNHKSFLSNFRENSKKIRKSNNYHSLKPTERVYCVYIRLFKPYTKSVMEDVTGYFDEKDIMSELYNEHTSKAINLRSEHVSPPETSNSNSPASEIFAKNVSESTREKDNADPDFCREFIQKPLKLVNIKSRKEMLFQDCTEAAKMVGCHPESIYEVLEGKYPSCKGYYIAFCESPEKKKENDVSEKKAFEKPKNQNIFSGSLSKNVHRKRKFQNAISTHSNSILLPGWEQMRLKLVHRDNGQTTLCNNWEAAAKLLSCHKDTVYDVLNKKYKYAKNHSIELVKDRESDNHIIQTASSININDEENPNERKKRILSGMDTMNILKDSQHRRKRNIKSVDLIENINDENDKYHNKPITEGYTTKIKSTQVKKESRDITQFDLSRKQKIVTRSIVASFFHKPSARRKKYMFKSVEKCRRRFVNLTMEDIERFANSKVEYVSQKGTRWSFEWSDKIDDKKTEIPQELIEGFHGRSEESETNTKKRQSQMETTQDRADGVNQDSSVGEATLKRRRSGLIQIVLDSTLQAFDTVSSYIFTPEKQNRKSDQS